MISVTAGALIERRSLGISDQAVCPEVGDLDFESVGSGFDGVGDFKTVRVLPDYAEILSVEFDPRYDIYLTEIQIKDLALEL